MEVGAEGGNAVEISTEKGVSVGSFSFSLSSVWIVLCSSFSRAANDAETIQA